MSSGKQLTPEQQDAIATFQGITNMDSTEQCVSLLESHGWNLETAVATALAMKGDGGDGGGGGGGGVRPPRPQSEPQRLQDPVVPSAEFANVFAAALRQTMQLPPNTARPIRPPPSSSSSSSSSSAAAAAPNPHAVARPVPPAPRTTFMSAGASGAAANNPGASIAVPRGQSAASAAPAAGAAPSSSSSSSASSAARDAKDAKADPPARSWYQSIPGAGLVSGFVGGAYRFAASMLTGGSSDSKQQSGAAGATPVAAPVSESEQFTLWFEQTYAGRHPQLAHGTYSDAIRAAKNAGRMLFIYLHSDAHDDSPRFCSDVLCSEAFRDFLNENFVCWFGSIKHSDAYRLSGQLNVASFPFIAVLSPMGNQLAVVYHRSGLPAPDAVLAELVHTLDAHRQRNAQRERKTANLSAQRQLIEAQDREYKEALEADRAKQNAAKNAEKKEAELREQRKKAADEQAKRDAEAAEQARIAAAKLEETKRAREALRDSKRASLPDEPAAGPDVAAVRVALLNAAKITRRFHLSTKLRVLYDWIETHDASGAASASASGAADELPADKPLQLVATHPRRVFTDPDLELKAMGLGRQIMLFAEERDAPSSAAGAAAASAPSASGALVDADEAPAEASAASSSLSSSSSAPEPLAVPPPSALGRDRSRDRPDRPPSKLVQSLTRQSSSSKP